jgi:hypothetical protein
MDPETGPEGVRQDEHRISVETGWARYHYTFWPSRRYVFVMVGPETQETKPLSLDIGDVELEKGREPSQYSPNASTVVSMAPSAASGIFVTGAQPSLNFQRSEPKRRGSDVHLLLTATNFFGQEIALPKLTLKPGQHKLDLPTDWHGWYRIRVKSTDPDVTLITPDVRIAIVPKPVNGETVLGMNHAFADQYLIDAARKVGISQYRDWSMKWDQLEPKKGEFDWEAADEQVNRVLDRQSGVIALLPPFPSSEWSSAAPKTLRATGDLGDRIRQSWAPSDPSDLARFARLTTVHFKDRVHVWEFLNEPIFTGYSLPGPKYGPADYVSLLRTTAQAIRSADPTCRIIGGAAADPARLTFDMFDADLLSVIDILNLHMYPGLTSPEKYLPEMMALNKQMDVRGKRKPIWITEFSYYGIDTPPREPFIPSGNAWGESRLLADEIQCANYTLRYLAIMLSQGVQRVFIHAGTNASVNFPETECCLFDEGGVPRKVAAATAEFCSLMGAHPRPIQSWRSPSGVYAMVFDTGKQAVAVAWTIGAKSIIVAPAGTQSVDTMGNPVDTQKVILTESPVYIQFPVSSTTSVIKAIKDANSERG